MRFHWNIYYPNDYSIFIPYKLHYLEARNILRKRSMRMIPWLDVLIFDDVSDHGLWDTDQQYGDDDSCCNSKSKVELVSNLI